MKYSLIILGVCLSFCVNAQIISTVAGGGTLSPESIPATSARLQSASGSSIDKKNNFYFINGYIAASICKIDTLGIIHTIAGNNIVGFSGDGSSATSAQFNYPIGIAVDSFGNVFIGDRNNHRIRKINSLSNIITTYAGNGTPGFSGDGGMATNASLTPVGSIGIDVYGNMYFEDSTQRIRKIDQAGIITTIAGNGIAGTTGDGGPATSAEIAFAYGICNDQLGNIYFSDHNVIRKINVSTGTINTFAGNGNGTYSGDGIPAISAQMSPYALSFDLYGNLWICDFSQRIRMIDPNGIIHTIVGDGIAGFIGDGDSAISAEIHDAEGIANDRCGNFFISDNGNRRIRKASYFYCDYLETRKISVPGELTIYPNPTNDQLQIDNITTPTNYRLYNIVGTTLRQGTLKEGSNSISLSALPTGIYLLELIDEDGNKKVKKIIKE